jgi:AmmeMemoRadiSam system protein A
MRVKGILSPIVQCCGGRLMDKESQKLLLKLARESILENLTASPSPTLEFLDKNRPKDLIGKEGAFVTLRKKGLDSSDQRSLRGCIGNVIGKRPLYRTVYRLAKESAFGDVRFSGVTIDEMDNIEIEVSVLTPLQVVDSYSDIVVGQDGVLLTSGVHRSLFLPQVAVEQNWDLETMLTNLSLKAGLNPNGWENPDCRFEVFQATIFGE